MKAAKRIALKSAHKVLTFWYGILLTQESMNDLQFRKEFQDALLTVSNTYKKKKKKR